MSVRVVQLGVVLEVGVHHDTVLGSSLVGRERAAQQGFTLSILLLTDIPGGTNTNVSGQLSLSTLKKLIHSWTKLGLSVSPLIEQSPHIVDVYL